MRAVWTSRWRPHGSTHAGSNGATRETQGRARRARRADLVASRRRATGLAIVTSCRATDVVDVSTVLAYVERDWAPLPIAPASKRPHSRVLRAVHGSAKWEPLRSRPATAEHVREGFAIDPSCNIGIITGKPSGGLVVADFDRAGAGTTHPPTPCVPTARGHHAYLKSRGPPRSRRRRFAGS